MHELTYKILIGVSVTSLLQVVGPPFLAYEILFVLVVIDTVTGLMKAIKNKDVSSRKFFSKGRHLLTYFLLIIASHQLTRYAEPMIWLEHFIVIFCAINEMISIIENATQLGIPVPPWVRERLAQYLAKPNK